MTGQTWSVFSFHSKAVRLIDGGYQVYPGAPLIQLGEPLEGGDAFDSENDAESWRLGRLEEMKHGNGS